MSKGQNSKKSSKKKPLLSAKEKRKIKNEKKVQRNVIGAIV